jgi:deoxyribonuclease-4
MSKPLIGSFVSMCTPKYLMGSLHIAKEIGENTFMIYTGSPQSVSRVHIDSLKIKEFKEGMKKEGRDLTNLIVHAPYIVNTATSNESKRNFTISFLKAEISRVRSIGGNKLILHPGNATDNIGIEKAIENTASLINELNKTNPGVIICLETMSGKGTEIGTTFEQLNQIIEKVHNKELVGVCFDTCHTFDAGYDLSDSEKLLDHFDRTIGLNYLKVIHLNDSLNERGSHKDRHANIGYGKIGFDNLMNIVYSEKTVGIPKILETPIIGDLITSYATEIKMIKDRKFTK